MGYGLNYNTINKKNLKIGFLSITNVHFIDQINTACETDNDMVVGSEIKIT